MADEKKSETVRVKILTSGALINTEEGTRAGLYDEVDVPRERAEYLVSVGAAAAVDDDLTTNAPPSGGATATPQGEAERLAAEQEAATNRREEAERVEKARRQPRAASTKAAPKTESK
jgi:hypothetical protein